MAVAVTFARTQRGLGELVGEAFAKGFNTSFWKSYNAAFDEARERALMEEKLHQIEDSLIKLVGPKGKDLAKLYLYDPQLAQKKVNEILDHQAESHRKLEICRMKRAKKIGLTQASQLDSKQPWLSSRSVGIYSASVLVMLVSIILVRKIIHK